MTACAFAIIFSLKPMEHDRNLNTRPAESGVAGGRAKET